MTETTAAVVGTDQALVQMLTGAWVTQLVAAVARLGIPDQLDISQPQSSEQLARAVGANAGALHPGMRARSSLGVFADVGYGRYTLTPIGARRPARRGRTAARPDHPDGEAVFHRRRRAGRAVNSSRFGPRHATT